MATEALARRAQLYAALGDPTRLALVDELTVSDRSPSELAEMLGIDSNLLAHHLGVLERLGAVERMVSHADRRRRYVHLVPAALTSLDFGATIAARRIVFVCTENAARSQLAEAMWNRAHAVPGTSGGISPATEVHPETVRAAERLGIDLRHARPRPLPDVDARDVVITVCDRAHEILRPHIAHLHWSVPDPAASTEPDAYDRTAAVLSARIDRLAPTVRVA